MLFTPNRRVRVDRCCINVMMKSPPAALLLLLLSAASSLATSIEAEAATTQSQSQPPQLVVFQKSIKIDDKWDANVIIREGQEPVDEIYKALLPYGVDFTARRVIFDEVKRAGVPYTKEFATLFSQRIVLDDDDNNDDSDGKSSAFSEVFTFQDNGSEPIDVIYNFAKQHSIESTHFTGLSNALLPKLCELVPCKRSRPRIWHNEITSNDGQRLGLLEILQGDEAIDTVDAFVQRLSVDVLDVGDRNPFRQNLLNVVCKSIVCTRSTPVVFRKAIKDQNGKSNGSIEVFENEEVIDAVVRFVRKSKLSLDEIALKNYMLQQACSNVNRVKCTRNVGVVYSQTIKNSQDGSPINTLTIYENEEPADKVYRWCQENNVAIGFMDRIMDAVCGSELTICNRREPVYFSIPISGPDGGYVNTLQLKVGHEPVDDIYAFFASNHLFKKGWDFQGVLSQICAKPNVDCRRLKAVKHFQPQFTMGGIEMGQVVIWEDEEVVDVLYNLRKGYNLTVEDQIVKFNEICKNPDVNCQRTRAVIFQKTESERDVLYDL